ncbi:hypothetical protein GGS26DRAFT_29014 [Hypomontagnella submonticulosa]|nr:hypothetical protein GGS26DRAFT_29014 [Hypomontagnella submonticulosa]
MTSISEKGLSGEREVSASIQNTRPGLRMVEKMPSTRRFFLTLLLGLLVTAGLANAVLNREPHSEDSTESETDHISQRDDSAFSRMLSSASPQALHEFLHAYFPGTYKHGVYESDHSAMEVVHANDPELATSIVQLAKRQSGNETTSATSSTTTDSSTMSPTSSSTTEQTSTQETSTAPPTSTDTTSTTSISSSTDSTSSSTPTQETSTTASYITTSILLTEYLDSTLATSTTPSSSTTRPPRTSTFTSTLPGGAKTTITSVEVVTPGAPEGASSTDDSGGSLQTGNPAPPARKPVVEAVIGVVVGGVLLV